MANSMRGEVLFLEAGENVVLRFSNDDFAALQSKFGDEWFDVAIKAIEKFDIAKMKAMVFMAARRDGVPTKTDLSLLSHVPLRDIAKKLMDALFLAVHGLTFEGFLGEFAEKATKAAAETVPQNGPDGSFIG